MSGLRLSLAPRDDLWAVVCTLCSEPQDPLQGQSGLLWGCPGGVQPAGRGYAEMAQCVSLP